MFDGGLFWRQFTSFGDRAENDEVDGSKDYLSVVYKLSKFLILARQTFNSDIRREKSKYFFAIRALTATSLKANCGGYFRGRKRKLEISILFLFRFNYKS